MRRIKQRLRASTLVETLVMMLVAGIIFLSVLDGLRLFTRLQVQRTEALLVAGGRTTAYYRMISLLADADSICSSEPGRLEFYRRGQPSELCLRDSALLFRRGAFCDTLFDGVGLLRLAQYETDPDTIEVGLDVRFTAKFAVRSAAQLYASTMDEIEKNYGYEE